LATLGHTPARQLFPHVRAVSIGAVPDRHSVTRRRARGRGLGTTVTAADGSLRVQDGPFVDTKEQLSGTSSSTFRSSTSP